MYSGSFSQEELSLLRMGGGQGNFQERGGQRGGFCAQVMYSAAPWGVWVRDCPRAAAACGLIATGSVFSMAKMLEEK